MRRLDAPVASRWLSIALRRALMAKVHTPQGVNGADFAAERAWLLLRMGESVAARAVVQSVDTEDYTPKLYQIAMQAALATGDPAELCPLADAAVTVSPERGWVLAQAMCAGLAGQPAKAQQLITAARKTGVAGGVDLLLAQKVAGAGSQGRQAVTIEWDGVDRLTAWRYGLATATGVAIPDNLLATVQSNVQSWRAQSPVLEPRSRAGAADQAAVRGVLSNAALVDLYGAIDAGDDQSTAENGTARDLRTAYTGADWPTRLDALKQLWDEPATPDGRFARLILTARAAARVPVDVEQPDMRPARRLDADGRIGPDGATLARKGAEGRRRLGDACTRRSRSGDLQLFRCEGIFGGERSRGPQAPDALCRSGRVESTIGRRCRTRCRRARRPDRLRE